MEVFFTFFLFVLGIFVGSFLNVLADRLPNDESPFKGRSHCEYCKHVLSWKDLIPLLSFTLLKGKCRYCGKKLSTYYPIVELTTGILFALTTYFAIYHLPFTIFDQLSITNLFLISHFSSFIFYLFIVSCLIVIFFADLKYGIIPDKITFSAIFVSFIYAFLIHNSLFLNLLLSAIGAALFFFALFAITKGRGMGFGDVKYAFLMGMLLGFPNIITALYVAFLTGALISLILVVWGKKKLKGATIPFGPFLVIGTIVGLFWGDSITQYALSFLLR